MERLDKQVQENVMNQSHIRRHLIKRSEISPIIIIILYLRSVDQSHQLHLNEISGCFSSPTGSYLAVVGRLQPLYTRANQMILQNSVNMKFNFQLKYFGPPHHRQPHRNK